MREVADNRNQAPGTRALAIARAAGQARFLLTVLDGLTSDSVRDRAHADRINAIEEAARLVASAATAAPSALRPEPLRAFAGLVMRLAVETADRDDRRDAFPGNVQLSALESLHGSLSATLMGLSLSLSNMQAALGNGATARTLPRPSGFEQMVRIPLPEARSWACVVEPAVSRLERDVLMQPVDAALRRDAWGLACLVSIALAHVSDHACVDARVALDRVAEAGTTLARAVALRASQSAGGWSPAPGDPEHSCLALVEVVEDGVRMIREALSRKEEDAAMLAWRLLARGRTGLGAEAIVRLAVTAGGAGRTARSMAEDGAALARAASLYEAEWAA